jgi:LmbE family N-acetylglucosaminyl deacetylase
MRQLGIHRSQIRLLGFPDDGLCVLASTCRAGNPFESPYTRRAAPPDSEQILRGTMYRGTDLDLELERVIGEFRPTLVVLPDPHDQHPDHCATNLIARAALDHAIFERSNELFVEGEPRAPAACWCGSENIANRPSPVP